MHIPASLLAKVKAETRRTGLSNGHLLITATEANHEKLANLFEGVHETGGRLFASRPVVKRRDGEDDPLVQLNIRLLPEDYTTLEALVTKYKAESRSRFATAVLEEYLRDTPSE